MQLARRITAWTGTVMICALITLASMTSAQWVKDHPATVEWTEVVLVVGAIGCAVFWLSTREKQAPVSANSGNVVSRDNSGKMIVAQHYYEAPAQAAEHTSIPEVPKYTFIEIPPPLPPVQRSLELSFERIPLVYNVGHSAWDIATQFDVEQQEAVVVWVSNPVQPKGVKGIDASRLSAHVKYSVELQWKKQISRAYWLRFSPNEITIESPDRAGLIIGLVSWSHWIAYSNPYKQPAEEGILQPAFRHLGEKTEMPKQDMDIDIFFLSQGVTVDEFKLRLTFQNDRPHDLRYR